MVPKSWGAGRLPLPLAAASLTVDASVKLKAEPAAHPISGGLGSGRVNGPVARGKLEDTAARSSAREIRIRTIAAPPPPTELFMSSPLLDVWEAASNSPYEPTIGKGSQFTVGIVLLVTGELPVLLVRW
jgi:hypothetical protein